jgi:hypothetical protein
LGRIGKAARPWRFRFTRRANFLILSRFEDKNCKVFIHRTRIFVLCLWHNSAERALPPFESQLIPRDKGHNKTRSRIGDPNDEIMLLAADPHPG